MTEHTEAPTTIKEVGTHIGYLREDMTEVKTLLSKHIEEAANSSKNLTGLIPAPSTSAALLGIIGVL